MKVYKLKTPRNLYRNSKGAKIVTRYVTEDGQYLICRLKDPIFDYYLGWEITMKNGKHYHSYTSCGIADICEAEGWELEK